MITHSSEGFEGAAERSRILLREFKKRRQPKRCDSLPCLQVVPATRQLYVCLRCRFTNAICKICPWCLSTCDAVAEVAVSVVRRQLSSPLLLTDAQKMQLAKIERAATASLSVREGCPSIHEVQETSSSARCATKDLPGGLATGRGALLCSVATATEKTSLQPILDQFVKARPEGRSLPVPSPEPLVTKLPPSTQTTRLGLPRTSRPLNTASPSFHRSRARMTNRDVVSTDARESVASQTSEPFSTLACSSTAPCLRRKRRMSGLRKRSSCTLRRRTNSNASSCRRDTAAFTLSSSSNRSKTESAATSPPESPELKKTKSIRFSNESYLRPTSPAPSPVSSVPTSVPSFAHEQFPLGHPQRPLYTAIRKNMSMSASSVTRPGSPAPSAAATSTTLDLHAFEPPPPRGTRSLDIDADHMYGCAPSMRYGSLTSASHLAIAYAARPALAGGFSVSGETEMRMDLARSRSMDGVPGDFAFKEGKGRRSAGVLEASVRAKVRSFGKKMKNLLGVKD